VSEEKALDELEKELWQRAANNEGSIRADAYVGLGRIAFDKSKIKESLALCETAREIFESLGKSEYQREIFDVSVGISKNYGELRLAGKAAEALGEAIEVAEIIGIEEVDDLYRDQGRFFFVADEYENSIAAHQRAIESTHKYFRDESVGIDYFNIAMGLYELGRYGESIDAYLKSRQGYAGDKEIANVADCDYRICGSYAKLENAVQIEFYGRRALDFVTMINDYRKIWNLKYYLGIAAKALGELEKAGELFEEAKNLAQAMGWQEWEFFITVDKEIAYLCEVHGMSDQASEILRRIASVEEIVNVAVVHEAA
jgi:tetratricopeptide (TPR) repeat protein